MSAARAKPLMETFRRSRPGVLTTCSGVTFAPDEKAVMARSWIAAPPKVAAPAFTVTATPAAMPELMMLTFAP
jgi:hypothetical protein